VERQLVVETKSGRYSILIRPSLLDDCSELQAVVATQTAFIISNETISPLYLAKIQSLLKRPAKFFILPDGEKYKNITYFNKIISQMLENTLGRDSILIALGGGVVGDLTGFVAACYQRGIPFIQIPTTLLAQVDASVGGKTAINHDLGKNMIGAFHQPSLVIIDPLCLTTLPDREFRSGLSEVIKYGLILDHDFYVWIKQNLQEILHKNTETLSKMIYRCCQLKAMVVKEDEKEQGIRALLNLGHTFAHAIEAETRYSQFLHGEAVSIGLYAAMRLSESLGFMAASDTQELRQLLTQCQLPTEIPSSLNIQNLLGHMKRDKKNALGQIRFIVNKAKGNACILPVNDEKLIAKSFPIFDTTQ